MNLKLNYKCQVIDKDKPNRSLNDFRKKNTVLYIASWALSGRLFFIHLPKILNHLPLSFTSSALNKSAKLWVTTFGCSDVTTLTRITLGISQNIVSSKVIVGSALLSAALFLVLSVTSAFHMLSMPVCYVQRACQQHGSHHGSQAWPSIFLCLTQEEASLLLSCYFVSMWCHPAILVSPFALEFFSLSSLS